MAPSRSSHAHPLLGRVARVCAVAREPLALLEEVAKVVRPALEYQAAGWLLVDPDTLLITGVYAEDVPRDAHLALVENELGHEDVNRFVDLAAGPVPAASLSAATGGRLDRSRRWSQLYGPHGYGDEIRAVFRSGGVAWGHVCLTRTADRPWFTAADVDLLARASRHIANGVRASLVVDGVAVTSEPAPPGFLVLDDDGQIQSTTPGVEALLDDLVDDDQRGTIVLHHVAQQARRLADGATAGPPARARVRLRSGEWLVVRGARLHDRAAGRARTAVVLEPARRADVAPMLVQLRGLTRREQEVTQLLVQGVPTVRMARSLRITPETLHGHVKSVFAKMGVSSRPELAAALSHEPAVRLAGMSPPRGGGSASTPQQAPVSARAQRGRP